jgi:hypothetical protein
MTTSPQRMAQLLTGECNSLTDLVFLLKEEQQIIMKRQTEDLMPLLSKIEMLLAEIRQYQVEREQILNFLIARKSHPDKIGLASQITLLPKEYQDACAAIAERVDVQTLMVHEFAWQNHVLLSHSLHFLEEVLAPWVAPQPTTGSVYGQNGSLQKGIKKQSVVQAVA